MVGNQPAPTRRTSGRRKFLKYAGAGISTIGIAGCQSLEGGGGGNETAATMTNTPGDVPKDLLKGETLTIGGMWPFPNDYSVGRDGMRGAELAVKEHNRSANGVLGADMKLLNRSTGISPAQSRKNTRELIVDKGADMINGGFLGQAYKQILEPVANNQTMSFFSGGASVPVGEKVLDNFDRYKYSFRTCCNMINARICEAHLMEEVADQMGWDRIAIYTENIEVYDQVAGALAKDVRDRGFAEVPIAERTSQSIIDWRPLYDRAEEEDCDLVCVNLALTGITAARQWGTDERPFDLGGLHLLAMAPDYWKSVGRVAPTIWTINMGGQDSRQTERMIPMMDRFEEEFGYRTSDYFTFDAYDAVNFWVEAIKQTGSTDPSDIIPFLEERTSTISVIEEESEYYGPPSSLPDLDWAYPHDRVWNGDTIETWNKKGWLPMTQWHGEKNGEAKPVTIAPKRAAGGEYRIKKTPWLR